jgi:hypothetical protein
LNFKTSELGVSGVVLGNPFNQQPAEPAQKRFWKRPYEYMGVRKLGIPQKHVSLGNDVLKMSKLSNFADFLKLSNKTHTIVPLT